MLIALRAKWGATAPLGGQMRLPSAGVWLHHSAGKRTDDPYRDQRTIERIGVTRFGRYSYSWAYHVDARMFLEGAGNTVGAHTAGRNSISHGLVLIGNFSQERLPDHAVADVGEFIRYGSQRGWWKPVLLGGHRDVKATACPGDHAYRRLNEIRAAIDPPKPPEEDDELKPFLVRNRTSNAVSLILGKGQAIRIYTVEDRKGLEERYGATLLVDKRSYEEMVG